MGIEMIDQTVIQFGGMTPQYFCHLAKTSDRMAEAVKVHGWAFTDQEIAAARAPGAGRKRVVHWLSVAGSYKPREWQQKKFREALARYLRLRRLAVKAIFHADDCGGPAIINFDGRWGVADFGNAKILYGQGWFMVCVLKDGEWVEEEFVRPVPPK
jgi:hypothetical protein